MIISLKNNIYEKIEILLTCINKYFTKIKYNTR